MTVPSSSSSASTDDSPPPTEVADAVGEVTASAPPTDGREELREFLSMFSGFVARRPHPDPVIVPVPVRSRRGLVAACGIVVLAGLLYQSWPHHRPTEMPRALVGAWVTDTKSYADRGFWIGQHQVAFRVGPKPDEINVYPVTLIDARSVRGDTTLYDIDYAVDGGTNRWSFRHVNLPQPEIVFVHQPQMTWTATPDRHPPIP